MKSFDNLSAIALGEVFTFLAHRSTRTITGVCSQPVSVMVQPEDGEPVLFHAFSAGQFSFGISSVGAFNLWFEGPKNASISLVVPPHSTTVEGDIERTFTKVGHRPAINPQLAAIQRELAALRGQVHRAAPAGPRFIEPDAEPVVESVPDPVPDPVPSVAPATTTQADADAMTPPADKGAK